MDLESDLYNKIDPNSKKKKRNSTARAIFSKFHRTEILTVYRRQKYYSPSPAFSSGTKQINKYKQGFTSVFLLFFSSSYSGNKQTKNTPPKHNPDPNKPKIQTRALKDLP